MSIPKAEPRSAAGTMSPVMPWTIGCRALKNSPEVNSSSPSRASDGLPPPWMLQPKISTSTEYTPVQTRASVLRLRPVRTAQSASQPPAGKPRMPAPALNAAVSAATSRLLCAASLTICTDQKLKNQRFHRIAM